MTSNPVLELYNIGDDMIAYFSHLDPNCGFVHTQVELSRQIGKGQYGAIFEVQLDDKIYAVKKSLKFKGACNYSESLTGKELICDEGKSAIPEFLISLLAAELYRSGRCINFEDAYYLMDCDENYYMMIEYLHPPRSTAYLLRSNPVLMDCILVQVLCAMAIINDVYDIIHLDLHDNNILLEPITRDMTYNDVHLVEADYYHYRIHEVELYIPACGFIAKIIDWGLANKFSPPRIIQISDYPETEEIKRSNDIRLLLWGLWEQGITSPLLDKILRFYMSTEVISEEAYYDLGPGFLWPTAEEILTNEEIMRDYKTKPTNRIIATLGYIE